MLFTMPPLCGYAAFSIYILEESDYIYIYVYIVASPIYIYIYNLGVLTCLKRGSVSVNACFVCYLVDETFLIRACQNS